MKEIIENYKNGIKLIIKNMTGKYNEDIEQEVYIKTWTHLDKYKETGKFKSWINTITANTCRDYLKSSVFKKSQQTDSSEDNLHKLSDNAISFDEKIIAKQRQEEIIKAINSLKPNFKEVIVMYEIYNLDYEEISKRIKKPVGTVKSRLFNARKELGVILKDLL
ncbi:MAG: sigma-70 family RNA polymerase sigma factor [Candidatus Gastranaerophilales bacterium]|nr:sigma-70 family RNA polymerase sigma factor [Candidatus Gastranaerophilales bacterium]